MLMILFRLADWFILWCSKKSLVVSVFLNISWPCFYRSKLLRNIRALAICVCCMVCVCARTFIITYDTFEWQSLSIQKWFFQNLKVILKWWNQINNDFFKTTNQPITAPCLTVCYRNFYSIGWGRIWFFDTNFSYRMVC